MGSLQVYKMLVLCSTCYDVLYRVLNVINPPCGQADLDITRKPQKPWYAQGYSEFETIDYHGDRRSYASFHIQKND